MEPLAYLAARRRAYLKKKELRHAIKMGVVLLKKGQRQAPGLRPPAKPWYTQWRTIRAILLVILAILIMVAVGLGYANQDWLYNSRSGAGVQLTPYTDTPHSQEICRAIGLPGCDSP